MLNKLVWVWDLEFIVERKYNRKEKRLREFSCIDMNECYPLKV